MLYVALIAVYASRSIIAEPTIKLLASTIKPYEPSIDFFLELASFVGLLLEHAIRLSRLASATVRHRLGMVFWRRKLIEKDVKELLEAREALSDRPRRRRRPSDVPMPGAMLFTPAPPRVGLQPVASTSVTLAFEPASVSQTLEPPIASTSRVTLDAGESLPKPVEQPPAQQASAVGPVRRSRVPAAAKRKLIEKPKRQAGRSLPVNGVKPAINGSARKRPGSDDFESPPKRQRTSNGTVSKPTTQFEPAMTRSRSKRTLNAL